jgi:hypothetical protein
VIPSVLMSRLLATALAAGLFIALYPADAEA